MRSPLNTLLITALIGTTSWSVCFAQQTTGERDQWLRVQSDKREQASTATAYQHGVSLETFRQISQQAFVELAVPIRHMRATARVHDRSQEIRLVGANDALVNLPIPTVQHGRLLTAKDVKTRASVCVISQKLGSVLFPNENPVGKRVRVDDDYFIVIGVLNAAPKESILNNPDIVIPLSTMLVRKGTIAIQRRSGSFIAEEYALNDLWIKTPDNSQACAVVERILDQSEPDKTFRITEFPDR